MSTIDGYLARLDSSLRGARRDKRGLLQEVHDHLVDATEAHVESGESRTTAERRAVREFGGVAEMVPAYQAILSAGQGRRLSLWMLIAVAIQPFAWGLWNTLPYGADADADGWLVRELDAYIEQVGLGAMILGVLAVVGCGVAVRYIGIREWVLRLALMSTFASGALIVLNSAAMMVASGDFSVGSLTFVTVVSWAPMAALAAASIDALRGLDSVTDCPAEWAKDR